MKTNTRKQTSAAASRASRLPVLFVLASLLAVARTYPGTGDVDLSFNPGSFINAEVYVVAAQSDGKAVIGGAFTTVRGAVRNGLARLNADGSADPTFNPAIGGAVSIVAQPDGKLLVGGFFSNGIARLNVDGSLDNSFNPGTGATGGSDPPGVHSIALQTDGKILIGGQFASFNGTTRNGIARLNSDGSLDTGFNPGTGMGGPAPVVFSVALQSDGKLLVGGDFTSVNGTARNRIARLNINGSLDTSFNPGTGANSGLDFAAVQADGKVLISGIFTSFNGTARNRIARLNSNGSLDTGFNPGTGADAEVYAVAVQADGKVLIGGDFSAINGTARNRIARLSGDGSVDTSLDPGTGAAGGFASEVRSVALQPDGRVLIGGLFTSVNGAGSICIARLNSDGTVDPTFHPSSGPNDWVDSLVTQPDGKVLIGGGFISVNGTASSGIARLSADGTLDSSFNPGMGAGGNGSAAPTVYSATVQPDGKVLIGGEFVSFDGTARNRIARLNADGSLDTSFDPGTGADSTVSAVALQADGKVLIGGTFGSVDGTSRTNIARLNTNGTLDTGFVANANGWIHCLTVQPDGKLFVGGDFTAVNGTSRGGIARLKADGSLDTSFDPGAGADSTVSAVALQADGRLLIGGWFASVSGTARNGIARLNSDGSLDLSFNPVAGPDGPVFTVAVQPDGNALIGGEFVSVNGTARGGIARLNADGGLDATFNPGSGADNEVDSVALQRDGKVLVAGSFASVNGVVRAFLARLYGDPFPPSLSIMRSNDSAVISWPVTAVDFRLEENFDFGLSNAWSAVGQDTQTNGGRAFVFVPVSNNTKFFRLRSK
jgi:uncharacterized delta-60 repeat protein